MAHRSNPVKKVRRDLYKYARLLGDITAISDGTIVRRIIRKKLGRVTQRGLGGVFRSMFR